MNNLDKKEKETTPHQNLSGKANDMVDELVRDLTKVGSIPKSEVRRRINDLLSHYKEELETVNLEKFERELRYDIGYSGGALDSDIITCETSGGRKSSQRFDVLLKDIKNSFNKILSHYKEELETKYLNELQELDNQKYEGAKEEQRAKDCNTLIERINELNIDEMFAEQVKSACLAIINKFKNNV